MNDDIPAWAIELIRQVERLNEKIPTHVDWVERNIKDHEMRIRALERKVWIVAGAAGVIASLIDETQLFLKVLIILLSSVLHIPIEIPPASIPYLYCSVRPTYSFYSVCDHFSFSYD